MIKAYYNDFYIVYQPYSGISTHSRRFLVSPNRLHVYIGKNNANKALQQAINLMTNKLRIKLRKYGIVDIYLK